MIVTPRGWLCSFLVFLSLLARSQQSVLTQHNDNARTGWYSTESTLTTGNVRGGSFGRLFTRSVDDQIYAQPLVVTNVNIPTVGVKNIVITATVNNSVYAFDADSPSVSLPYWQVSLTPPGSRAPKNTDMTGACNGGYKDFSGNIGIVGTPVIDSVAQTMYVVARSLNTSTNVFSQFLHALDIRTGAELAGSPVAITAQVNGSGVGNVAGKVNFDPQRNNQRPGLLLLNGIVYIGYSSHCDWQPYHGWLLGYDAITLQQKLVYNSTPDGAEAGIWMSGSGPSADDLGNIYLSTGNGTIGKNGNISHLSNRGESALQLKVNNNNLSITSFFTPSNFNQLEAGDLDFGVTQMLLIPNTQLVITGCKDGNLYLLDRNDMGGVNINSNNVIQSVNLGNNAHLRSSLAYYRGSTHEFIYQWSENTLLKAFPFNRAAGLLDLAGTISGPQGPAGNNGALLAVSSNGTVDSTAVLWVSHAADGDANQSVRPGILRAFAANDITQEIWNSSVNPNDKVGNYAKFVNPTIANGKVYLATFSNQLIVYGLTGNAPDNCGAQNLAFNRPVVATSVESNTYPASYAVDGDENTRWSSAFSDPQSIYVDLGQSYELCRAVLHWEFALGKDFQIQVSDDAQTWNTVATIAGNASRTNIIQLQAQGRYVRMLGTARGSNFGYSLYEFQVYGKPSALCPPPANAMVSNITPTSATLGWTVTGAGKYALQYKTLEASCWTTVGLDVNSFTLQNLNCGTDYFFHIATVCGTDTGAYSIDRSFTTAACAVVCGPLPTRWTSSDIGCVGITGKSCYDNQKFSMLGSGSGFDGTNDEMQSAYTTMVGDGEIVIRLLGMSTSLAQMKAGLMMREDLTEGSRNIFVGVTADEHLVLQYRTSSRGFTNVVMGAQIELPYWLKLHRAGSIFTAYSSADGLTWTPVGSPIDLGITNDIPMDAGILLSSFDNSLVAAADFDNFSSSVVAVPVQLISFNGKLTSAQTTLLKWTIAAETNVRQFIITRSNSGGNFIDIGTVAPHNAGNQVINYQFEDMAPPEGVNFYRLRIEDRDGRSTYSPVVLIRVTKAKGPILFPNPVSNDLMVCQGKEPILTVRVFDASGKLVISQFNNGAANMLLSFAKLHQGLYIVETKTGHGVYRNKILKW